MNVVHSIAGDRIEICPVFRGDGEPAYWELSVNDRVVGHRFDLPRQALRYIAAMYRNGMRRVDAMALAWSFDSEV